MRGCSNGLPDKPLVRSLEQAEADRKRRHCTKCFGNGYVLTDGPPGWEECVQSKPCPNGCKSVNG